MLSPFDKKLLNRIQNYVPVCSSPFKQLALELGSDEETILTKLQDLKDNGYIRRIGPFFNSQTMGFISTLVAVTVQEQAMESVASVVNKYSGVTHNYQREGTFNLWFTLITPDAETQLEILQEVKQLEGVTKLLSLPSIDKFKVNVAFELE